MWFSRFSFPRLWDLDFKVKSKSHVDFGPLHSGPVLYLLRPGMMVLRLPLVQEWLDARDATLVAHFLDTSVHSGSWCTNSIHCLWSSPQVLEFTVDQRNLPVTQGLSSNAIHVACAPLPTNLFPSIQPSMNMSGRRPLQTAALSAVTIWC